MQGFFLFVFKKTLNAGHAVSVNIFWKTSNKTLDKINSEVLALLAESPSSLCSFIVSIWVSCW